MENWNKMITGTATKKSAEHCVPSPHELVARSQESDIHLYFIAK